ncbi:hypothetical protein ACI5KX_04995 [Erythrobacter sp. GH1-10]|uniref:hypothetical protein n=1 Tax=Erythrobacter sp. GH1-10 TaxID=3349334 RepID=UPI0038779C74
MAAPPGQRARDDVRNGLRSVLSSADAFNRLDRDTRKDIAKSLVKIGSTALDLAEEEERSLALSSPEIAPSSSRPIAQAQSQPAFGEAARRLASTTRDTLEAVSFPRFVSELITGVFKAMNDSNQQQLTAFVELIRNVAASTDGFADANVGLAGARAWLAERFPGSFRVTGAEDDGFDDPAEMSPEERAEWQRERDAEQRLELLPGGSFPEENALRIALGVPQGQTIPTGNPESLVPLARAALARNKQQMLATMVQMGLQRIVIESGRLNASMKFHVDTSSATAEDRGSQFDMRNTVEARGGARFGPWGAEAKVQNTIGYVTTERSQTSEEINTELDLDSGVELIFRTDYVPLDRLAGSSDRERIRVNALNPEAEAQRIQAARTAREGRRQAERTARRSGLDSSLRTPTAPPPPSPLSPPSPTGAARTQQPAARSGGGSNAGGGSGGSASSGGGAASGGARPSDGGSSAGGGGGSSASQPASGSGGPSGGARPSGGGASGGGSSTSGGSRPAGVGGSAGAGGGGGGGSSARGGSASGGGGSPSGGAQSSAGGGASGGSSPASGGGAASGGGG